MALYENAFPSNYEEIKTFYPVWYFDVLEMDAIWRAVATQLDQIQESVEDLVSNGFIETADEPTIASLETFLRIDIDPTKALTDRRRLVSTFFSGNSHIGAKEIKETVATFTQGNTEVTFENSEIRITVTRDLSERISLLDCLLVLKRRIPAHLGIFFKDIFRPIPFPNHRGNYQLYSLKFLASFFNSSNETPIFLDAQKVLDGTWLLNQMLRGVNFRELVFCMPRFLERESLAGVDFTPGVLSLPNRFGSIQLALAAFLIRLPNYFDLSFVWLNGQRVLDGSWLLNQAVHGLYFPQFALQTALSEEERLADRMHLMLNPLVLRSNTESFQLDQMAFWLRFANYFDLSFVCLNGRRLLDGSWLLNQEVHGLYFPNLALHTAFSEEEHLAKQIHLTLNPLTLDNKTERFQLGRMAVCLRFAKHFACGVACDALALTTAFQEAERLSACIKTKLTMQTVADLKTRLSAQSKLSEQTRIQAARLATGPWRIQTASKLSACTITQDSMWRLDGKRLCDGRYKLNANIIKETI